MTSSQMAVVLRGAVIAVAAMLFTAAQLRVLKGNTPRRTRYAVAWILISIMLGAFISYLDAMVGRAGIADRVASFAFAAVTAALALGAGARLSQSPFWTSATRFRKALALLLIHALIVYLADRVAR